jgi:hypothetical protein
LKENPELRTSALASDDPEVRAAGVLATGSDELVEDVLARRVSPQNARATLDAGVPLEQQADVARRLQDANPENSDAARNIAADAVPERAPLHDPFEANRKAMVEAHQKRQRRLAVKADDSLFTFLAKRGGIAPDPDVKYLLDGNRFIPGVGPLVRKNGMSLDRAWQAAVEAGYIFDEGFNQSNVALATNYHDLLALIGKEAGSAKQFRVGYTPEPTKAQAKNIDARNAELEANDRATVKMYLDEALRKEGYDPALVVDDDLLSRTMRFAKDEPSGDILIAYERAVMESAEALERKADVRRQELEIPGWDFPDDAAAAPARGGDLPPSRPGGDAAGERAGGTAGEAPRGDGANDRAPPDGQLDPTTAKPFPLDESRPAAPAPKPDTDPLKLVPVTRDDGTVVLVSRDAVEQAGARAEFLSDVVKGCKE